MPAFPGPSYTPQEPARSYDTRPVNQQYRSHATPTFNSATEPERPQYARFESVSNSGKNDDALPAMPTWGEAKSTHVEETVMPEKKGDVEMDRLNHNGSVTGSQISGVTGMQGPRRSPARSPPIQTEDGYGLPGSYQNDTYAAGAMARRPSPNPRDSYNGHYAQDDNGYRGISPVHAQPRSPVYNNGIPPIGAYSQTPPPQQNPYRRSSSDQLLNTYDQQPYDQQPYDRQQTFSPQTYDNPYDPAPAPPGAYGQAYSTTPTPAAELPSPSPPHTDNPYRVPSPRHNAVEMPYHENRPTPPPVSAAPQSQYTPISPPERQATHSPTYPGQQTYNEAPGGYPGQQTYQAFQPGR